jgi:multicomponent K+:H+ antiporter subunit E
MKYRLLPSPPISLLLFVAWLMLNASLSAGHLLLAAVFAVAVPLVTERLRPEKARLRHPFVAARLAAVVLKDIVLSNIEVARRILGPESAIQPRFVWLPLRLRDPHAIVALAGIITLTPGTLSAEISADRHHLLIHAFNVEDEATLIRDIQTRYEAPLRQIFE